MGFSKGAGLGSTFLHRVPLVGSCTFWLCSIIYSRFWARSFPAFLHPPRSVTTSSISDASLIAVSQNYPVSIQRDQQGNCKPDIPAALFLFNSTLTFGQLARLQSTCRLVPSPRQQFQRRILDSRLSLSAWYLQVAWHVVFGTCLSHTSILLQSRAPTPPPHLSKTRAFHFHKHILLQSRRHPPPFARPPPPQVLAISEANLDRDDFDWTS